jgi:hypothetical protein
MLAPPIGGGVLKLHTQGGGGDPSAVRHRWSALELGNTLAIRIDNLIEDAQRSVLAQIVAKLQRQIAPSRIAAFG